MPDYQKIVDALRLIADEIATLVPVTTVPVPQPKLPILTSSRLAALKAMQTGNSSVWQKLKAIADGSKLTPNPNYDDPGLAAAILYNVTGDKTYADAAWNCLIAYSQMPTGAPYDGISDAIVELPIVYAMIKGSGTQAQITQFLANLTVYAQVAIGASTQVSGGIPASNLNYCIPFYFGLALIDELTGSTYLSQSSNLGGFVMPVGGLDATASDRSSARNCIKQCMTQLAAGGAWPEGPYDAKSIPRLILGWMSMQDILGVDHFSEIAAWIPSACDAVMLDYAKDFLGFYPWGDRTRLGYDYARRLSIYAALQAAAVRIGDTARAANIGYLIQNILAKLPLNQIDTHFWFFYDPAFPVGTRAADPVVNHSPGVGLFRRADANDLFSCFFPSTIDINHEQNLQDIYWYSGNEVVLGRPYGYSLQLAGINIAGQTSGNCYGANGVAVCGLSKMAKSGPVDQHTAANYSYFAGSTAGLIYGPGGNNPSVEWLHELTRTVLYVPSIKTVFICDRANLDDPRILDLTKYSQPDRSAILASTHLVEQIWHCPVQPTSVSASTLTWSTAGGQHLELNTFSTTGSVLIDQVDENVLWKDVSSIGSDQKKWQFRVHPDAARPWNCIVTCIRLNPSATPVAKVIQTDVAGFTVDGVNVLFGIDQTGRLIDATKVGAMSGTTYLVGCAGAMPVIVSP